MKFEGSLHGTTYRDPKEFAEAVKANPPTYSKGDTRVTLAGTRIECVGGERIPMTPRPDEANGIEGFPIFKKPRIVLTAAEREWLGASVRRSDGAVGQVWALAPQSGYVWVVVDGDYWFAVHTDALKLVQSRVDQLALDP